MTPKQQTCPGSAAAPGHPVSTRGPLCSLRSLAGKAVSIALACGSFAATASAQFDPEVDCEPQFELIEEGTSVCHLKTNASHEGLDLWAYTVDRYTDTSGCAADLFVKELIAATSCDPAETLEECSADLVGIATLDIDSDLCSTSDESTAPVSLPPIHPGIDTPPQSLPPVFVEKEEGSLVSHVDGSLHFTDTDGAKTIIEAREDGVISTTMPNGERVVIIAEEGTVSVRRYDRAGGLVATNTFRREDYDALSDQDLLDYSGHSRLRDFLYDTVLDEPELLGGPARYGMARRKPRRRVKRRKPCMGYVFLAALGTGVGGAVCVKTFGAACASAGLAVVHAWDKAATCSKKKEPKKKKEKDFGFGDYYF